MPTKLSRLLAMTGTTVIALACPLPLRALPGDSRGELLRNWSVSRYLLPKPEYVRKYNPYSPDLRAEGRAAGGSLVFTISLNKSGISVDEGIDFRPDDCEDRLASCTGKAIFQPDGNSLGHLLISEIFGAEVLEDFKHADRLKAISNSSGNQHSTSVKRFYAGRRFNYSTFVHSEPGQIRMISHFTVHIKNDVELWEKIKMYDYCSKPGRDRDPLCYSE